MAFDRPDPRLLAFPVVAAALFADDADACPAYPEDSGYSGSTTDSYDCASYDALAALTPFNAEAIPTDGVLVLQAAFTGAWGQDLLDHAAVTVTQNGDPVPGALEPAALDGWAVWRPQAPLIADATFKFSATLSNPGVPPACAADMIPVAFDFFADAGPAEPLTPPTLAGDATLYVSPYESLTSLACCPGVTPSEYLSGCGGGSQIDYDPSQCTATQATGYFIANMTGTPAADGATAHQLYYTLESESFLPYLGFDMNDLEFAQSSMAPFCATLVAHPFVGGEPLAGPELCFGDSFGDQLGGPYPIDPPDTFTCVLQQCVPAGEQWDLEMCTPYVPGGTSGDVPTGGGEGDTDNTDTDPGEDDDKGCAGGGCATDTTGGLAVLMLAAVIPFRRRRRA